MMVDAEEIQKASVDIPGKKTDVSQSMPADQALLISRAVRETVTRRFRSESKFKRPGGWLAGS